MTLLTIADAAKAIRMSEGFVKGTIRRKELAVVRLGKVRGVRIRPEDLAAFVVGKIAGTARSHEQEAAALAKMQNHLNQWVTPHDR